MDAADQTAAPVGAVMVVGAGIGGMQASMDLANSGFKVYLVEEKTAIGGRMAQLDKTFPTNDCAMCIISPKLVETGRHRNIEILTGTRVQSISGSAGHFTVRLARKPRHVRLDKCTGCGECIERCPVGVPDEFNLEMTGRRAIFKRYAQAIPGAFAIEKVGVSPCRFACPAGVNAHAYVALIAQRRFREALEVERRNNPFPAICGRICPHPCEEECTRGKLDQPVAIAALKRFLADWEFQHPEEGPAPPEIREREERVAVIGGGPAGIAAARDLRLRGYRVTIFESMPELGGMLRYGIPDYRLPGDLLAHEIKTAVLDLGVEARLNTRVGRDIGMPDLRREGYRAFLLAIGAHAGLKLGVPGEDQIRTGIVDAVDFLRELNLGRPIRLHGKVFVVGGGNVAMDAARGALRLGAGEVTVLYRRSREQMPANPWEIQEAEREGVKFRYLCAPAEIAGDGGGLRAVRCIQMRLGEPDESGRRRPLPVEGSEFELGADWLIPAIGQRPDVSALRSDVGEMVSGRGVLEVDELTLQSKGGDVFAAGDSVLGPATAIQAIAAGREAAVSIDRYLNGRDLREGRKPPGWTRAQKSVEGLPRQDRPVMPALPLEERRGNFREVELGYSEEQAVAEAGRCLDCAVCSECLMCVDACPAEAIEHQPAEELFEDVEVGSVILSPGFETFDPRLREEFGYGRYQNVISSLEFERLLSASGPTEGHVHRPSDGAAPLRIAWIQCVGSRDHSCDRDYCSSVCCMYTAKQAVIAKEHDPRIAATVFYIDLRAFGKGFDDYVTRAREHHGVRYLRAMPSRVFEDPLSGNLQLRYVDESGRRVAEEFDLVVLSVGVQISKGVRELAARVGVDLDEFGFARTSSFEPLASSRLGVFVCGVFAGPKDIPETVAEASGAAGVAAAELSAARGTLVTQEQFPPERVIPDDEPLRIGVFVCHCGINIAAIVDVTEVAEYAGTLPGVVYADHLLYTCSQDNQEKIREIIKAEGLNRVVVASCSPRTHEVLFQQTLSQAGLNKYLFDMANIRDQCSWVHRRDNRRATEKAKRMVRMAVANVARAEALEEREFDVEPSLLVIGGGLAGMTAALQAARQGFGVYLVEKEKNLGGNLQNLRRTFQGEKAVEALARLEDQVRARRGIRVFTSSQVVEHSGYIGNFETEIMTPGGAARTIKHGAILVATGGREARPAIYGLGEHRRVWTQTEFEQALEERADLGVVFPHVVMIQCAGSRDDHLPYCSRVCCNQAIKNARAFKRRFPSSRVDILYRDIRSYGLLEVHYRQARLAGVNFVRYDPEDNPLRVETGAEKPRIGLTDTSIGEKLSLEPDLLVLSVGIVPNDVEELGVMLHAQRNDDGFFIEAHAKLRPVDLASEGLFLAGLAHGPKSIPETTSQASAAVSRAATILSLRKLHASGVVSRVDPDLCAACLTCVRACPYEVPFINEEHVAEINPVLCQGCGVCAAECPAKAIGLGRYRDEQITAKLDALQAQEGVTVT